MIKKISVSEIERLLYYIQDELKGYRVPDKVLYEGWMIHSRLGYNQPEVFKRFYEYESNGNKEYWLVYGTPDKIDYENGIIFELKTYRSARAKKSLLNVAKTQVNLYCWLTGLRKYCIDLYNINEGKITDSICEDYSETKAVDDIREAIERKLYLEKIRTLWEKKR